MSTRKKRPVSHYVALARKLSRTNPSFDKYKDADIHDPEALTPAEKAAIQREAYRTGVDIVPTKRSDESYIESARNMSEVVPAFEKYKRVHKKRTKLNNGEKAAIRKKEDVLKYAKHLVPIKGEKRRKQWKNQFYAPGVAAVNLENITDDATVTLVRKDLIVTNNGRTWLYWSLDTDAPAMKKGARDAFTQPAQIFPMEAIAKLVEKAFKRPTTKEVYLWAKAGRVGHGFLSLKSFLYWFNKAYGGYTEQDKWVNGIAIRLGEADGNRRGTDDDYEETEYDDEDMGDDE